MAMVRMVHMQPWYNWLRGMWTQAMSQPCLHCLQITYDMLALQVDTGI